VPAGRPHEDDAKPGLNFFRTWFTEKAWQNLTLPRTFVGRSEIEEMSFKNCDLSQSAFCWNDFANVDFTDCDLRECDLRASRFTKVNFVRAILRNADLRHSDFKNCDFSDADMRGAKFTRAQRRQLRLSEQQREQIDWQSSAGELPEGG
jgi:uncharacterized protein YjbI with pentapeptide repeats